MMAEVPFFGLKRETEALRPELMERISAVFDHGQVLQSQEVAEFESKIASVTGRKYAVATALAPIVSSLRFLPRVFAKAMK